MFIHRDSDLGISLADIDKIIYLSNMKYYPVHSGLIVYLIQKEAL